MAGWMDHYALRSIDDDASATLLCPLDLFVCADQCPDSVAERSNAVNSKLQRRRDHIEELNRVRSLLRKLQVVFDLPKKLRAAIDEDALEIAVDDYSAAAPVLK
eukprot:scaffold218859_cov30-Prasinocladus_malaysianus.AAC.1